MKPLIITPRIEEILRTIHFYRYMTALDVTYLLYSPGSLTHCRDILKVLCGGNDYIKNQYLYRFPLPEFVSVKTDKVFTLGARGRDYLVRELGMRVDWYFRPEYIRHLSHGLINHNLTLTRFLVCCHLFTRKGAFTIKNLRTCYELEKQSKKVIPDAWVNFERAGIRYPLIIEIDQGSAYSARLKKHIQSRIDFLRSGDYKTLFGERGGLIVYATTGELPKYKEARVKFMVACCSEVLKEMGLDKWASIFRFGAVVRKEMFEAPLFEGPLWLAPGSDSRLPLLPGK